MKVRISIMLHEKTDVPQGGIPSLRRISRKADREIRAGGEKARSSN